MELQGDIVSLVSPHAGYIYSGQVAAYAYSAVRGRQYDSVIVVGPSHRAVFRGISIYEEGGFETPLGVVPVDNELASRILADYQGVASGFEHHVGEHSIEIQLPFLQVALAELRFVPILMGDQNRETCEKLARAISLAALDKRVLIVGSSDLSHYHPYDEAVRMDAVILRDLEMNNPEGLVNDLRNHTGEACGGGPMVVAMMAAREMGAKQSMVLKYMNSGDVTGDKSGVVGYAAAAYYRKVHS